jgi:hypothetical protein
MKRVVVVVVAIALLALLAPTAPARSPKRQTVDALVYGDSISWQAMSVMRTYATIGDHAVPGYAPCNYLAGLKQDRQAYAPKSVLIEFFGNTPACMDGRDFNQAYVADITKIASFWKHRRVPVKQRRVPVIMVLAPRPNWTYVPDARGVAPSLTVAANLDLAVRDAGATVENPDGSFTFNLPCLPNETEAMRCTNGLIQVRSEDGVHLGGCFCPYSSGAYRFGRAELGIN